MTNAERQRRYRQRAAAALRNARGAELRNDTARPTFATSDMWEQIREFTFKYELANENAAIRMLIDLGFERVKEGEE